MKRTSSFFCQLIHYYLEFRKKISIFSPRQKKSISDMKTFIRRKKKRAKHGRSYHFVCTCIQLLDVVGVQFLSTKYIYVFYKTMMEWIFVLLCVVVMRQGTSEQQLRQKKLWTKKKTIWCQKQENQFTMLFQCDVQIFFKQNE